MSRKALFYLGALCLGVTMAAGCGKNVSTETEEVTGNAYVSENGKMLTDITYKIKGGEPAAEYETSDFHVTYTDGKEEKAIKVENVQAEDGKLTLLLENTAAGTMSGLSVDSKDNGLDAENISIYTKTADEFVKKEFVSSEGVKIEYWLYQPKEGGPYPLMVWEHGGGENRADAAEGANIWANRGAVAWIEDGLETCVLSVQYPENYSFGIAEKPEQLQKMEQYNTAKYELIQQMIADGTIDESRIYICGASSGGGGAIRFMMQYPDLFAAALVLSAKDVLAPISEPYGLSYQFDESKLTISQEAYEACYRQSAQMLEGIDLNDVAIWFVQADKDPVCTSYTSKIMYQILKEKGAENNRITMWTDEDLENMGVEPLAAHVAYNKALENQEMITWIYGQQRQAEK